MDFIATSEKKFGKFAIQGLTTKLVVIQVLFFLYIMLSVDRGVDYHKVILDLNIGQSHIISDIIFIVATPASSGFLWMFFGTYLFLMFGHALEQTWGDYKFNLYILTQIVISLLLLILLRSMTSSPINQLITMFSTIHFIVFLSFTTYFPKFELLLFFILPTPVRIIAYLYVGYIFVAIWEFPLFLKVIALIACFGSYLLFHMHLFIHKQKQKIRKASYDKRAQNSNPHATFHKCHVCGKTEEDDKDLEFRICDDGEEYCLEHLKSN